MIGKRVYVTGEKMVMTKKDMNLRLVWQMCN